jgi:hypothetical protein
MSASVHFADGFIHAPAVQHPRQIPVNVLSSLRPLRRTCALRPGSTSCGLTIRCDAPAKGGMIPLGCGGGDELGDPDGFVWAPKLERSGGTSDALPTPLGSESALGLAGPNGTPLMAVLPAPAVPAGGVS